MTTSTIINAFEISAPHRSHSAALSLSRSRVDFVGESERSLAPPRYSSKSDHYLRRMTIV